MADDKKQRDEKDFIVHKITKDKDDRLKAEAITEARHIGNGFIGVGNNESQFILQPVGESMQAYLFDLEQIREYERTHYPKRFQKNTIKP